MEKWNNLHDVIDLYVRIRSAFAGVQFECTQRIKA